MSHDDWRSARQRPSVACVLCVTAFAHVHAEEHALQQPAVVQIGGCSGVCVKWLGRVMPAICRASIPSNRSRAVHW